MPGWGNAQGKREGRIEGGVVCEGSWRRGVLTLVTPNSRMLQLKEIGLPACKQFLHECKDLKPRAEKCMCLHG